MNTLLWLRTDLRVLDNPALFAAMEEGPVIAVFVVSPSQWQTHDDAAVKVDFWLRNLTELGEALGALHIPLKLVHADTWDRVPDAIEAFCTRHEITAIHMNAEWGLNEQRRDSAVVQRAEENGRRCVRHQGATLFTPGTITTGKGDCYKVFTPFALRCRDSLRSAPLAPPSAPSPQAAWPAQPDPLPQAISGFSSPGAAVRQLWPAGADAAFARLESFLDGPAAHYDHDRDIPSLEGTSGLSPYLAAGVISVGQCVRAALAANQGELDSGKSGIRTWITELLWREFYLHLLAANPALSMHRPMRPETDNVRWRDSESELLAWQQGRTGIPIIDAAMRQMLATGWMHNRLRMLAAMFLSKNLLLNWRLGEAWFMQQLIDGDLASNNGGWQWSASTGADAVPYFRVFNPLTQSQKFDPAGIFIARWLPELSSLPAASRHAPSQAQRDQTGYPAPIVDLGESRRRAIDAFKGLK